jgi:class 3 adenylate cyclase/ligand-binding sensor domain-containing protein
MFRPGFSFGALLLSAIALHAEINPETGSFFFQQYSPKTYGAKPQNWAIVQDHRGVMYFGNRDGVLEYDGQKWRKIALPNSSTVRSLAIDDEGTVYVGGQREIGFLQADKTGTLKYVSLLDRLGHHDQVFNDVWTTLNTKSGVVFSSDERLFRWSRRRGMQVWKYSTNLSSAFLIDGVPYLIKKGSGLQRLVEDSLEPVPGGEIFRSESLRGVFRFAGSMVVATRDALYIQQGNRFKEYQTDAKSLLRQSQIYRCLPLGDNKLAIGTTHGGLILLSASGKLLRLVGRDAGLRSSNINALFGDRDGGLWLALNGGLNRIEIGSSMTRFTERDGVEEIVLSIQRHDGLLYLGTMAGLLRLVPDNVRSARFDAVPGIYGQVFALLSTVHGLLAGSPAGIYQVTPSGIQRVLGSTSILSLAASLTDPSTVYATGSQGLFVLRFNGKQWQQVRYWNSVGENFRSVVQDVERRVWVTTRSDIWRFNMDADPAAVERFSTTEGVPTGSKTVYRLREGVVFATSKGLLRFDAHSKRFVPDWRLGKYLASESRPISTVYETPDGDIWLAGEGYHGILKPQSSGGFTWIPNPLARSGIAEIYGFYVDPDRTVWASGMEGELVRYQASVPSSSGSGDLRALLRRVQAVSKGQLVFGGAGNMIGTHQFRYEDNTLRFDYAAPWFEDPSRTEFRVLLGGLQRDWSPWTNEASKEYTNLWEGKYVFQVQARDLYGRISREASFEFHVLPPFYRQGWAYALYAIIGITVVWLIIKWRLTAIASRNRKLEEIIDERTNEIKAQEQRTETLLLNILPAQVAEELRTTGTVQPLSCEDITVCFTDFVGFTLSCENLIPCELVEALHKYFTEFDQIIDRYGLEKLKTIGDSYMFVSGIPKTNPAHAVDAVLAALEIVEVVESFADSSPGWSIRVGVHSGPVVAGVVGLRKFAFDIWGQTVNIASRHESSGQPNCVNISARTYELVRDFFHCEPRGSVPTKEGRNLEMYFARCIREDVSSTTVNAESFRDLYMQTLNVPPPAKPRPKSREISKSAYN